MWNLLSRLPSVDDDITVPNPASGFTADRIVTILTDFIIRYPVPVTIFGLVVATIAGWRRGGVFKGIIVGFFLAIGILFLLRGGL
jgi:hypothetical protein